MSQEMPYNFSSAPSQSPQKYFYNVCVQFKKQINDGITPEVLEEQMQTLINASKDMIWKEPKHDVWKKQEGEKIVDKIFAEFMRFVKDLREKRETTSSQDLLEALDQLMQMIKNERVD